MRCLLVGVVCFGVVLFSGGAAQDARAESSWDAIRPAIFSERPIHVARDIVRVFAPYRTFDDRIIPISVKSEVSGDLTIKSLTLVADDNPMPVIGIFRPAGSSKTFNVAMNIRLDGTSSVRAVVETSDGALYMAKSLVKTSGQGACASPPVTDLKTIDKTLGQMEFKDVTPVQTAGNFTSLVRRGRVKLTHPNLTGLQMDQITLRHIPARYVNTLTVSQGKQRLFTLESGITLSENPEIEFDYRLNGAASITVQATDTDGTKFERTFPLGPGS